MSRLTHAGRDGAPTLALPDPRRVSEVLLVTPPMRPPLRNGTQVIARDLALSGADYRYRILGARGCGDIGGAVRVERIAGPHPSRFIPDQMRVLARLLRPDRCAVHHFFFAPHPRASRAARASLRLSRKRSLHTIPSQPAPEAELGGLLFADRTVVVSEATALLFRSAGVTNVDVIRPTVALPTATADRGACRRRLAQCGDLPELGEATAFLYPGDLEFSDGAATFTEAALVFVGRHPDARFLMACRPKTAAAEAAYDRVKARIRKAGCEDRWTWLGVVSDMPSLLGAVDAVVLSVDSLYAKVDIPIVLLEAMALGRPAIVSDVPSLTELAGLGEGVVVVPRSEPTALAQAMESLLADADHRASLGRGARRTVQTHFDPACAVAAYERLYTELLVDG